MVDTCGRIRTRQANVVSARSRLHSPLFRNTRSSTSTTSSTVDENDDDPLVRETPLYRRKQVFFGADFDDKAAPPQRSPASTRSSGTDSKPIGIARSTTGSSLRLDDDALAECSSDTTLSGLDAPWEMPPLTAENIGKALRDHSYPRALAVSSEISDSLSRMKMRKHEMEMAAVVMKVQAQLKTMEDVIKELQNEHMIKNEMLKTQIAATQRVAAERDHLKHALLAVSTSNNQSHDTQDDVSLLQSSLQAFMNQTEHTQYLIVEQLKTMAAPKGSPRRGSMDAHKIEASVKAAMGDFAQLQRTMLSTLETSRPVPAPALTPATTTPATTPAKARALPSTSSGFWKAAVFAMLAIWLATLGVGTGHVPVSYDALARYLSQDLGDVPRSVVTAPSTPVEIEMESVPTVGNVIDAPLDDSAVVTTFVDVDGDGDSVTDGTEASTTASTSVQAVLAVEAMVDLPRRETALDGKDRAESVDAPVESSVADEDDADEDDVQMEMTVTPDHMDTDLVLQTADGDVRTDKGDASASVRDGDFNDDGATLSNDAEGTADVEQVSLVVAADKGLDGSKDVLVDTGDEPDAVATSPHALIALPAADAQVDAVPSTDDAWSDAIGVLDADASAKALALVAVFQATTWTK
ncbi:hypothetical protein SPRG_16054 [Saprolegnia parasitica CBS 223.65]|uniref:Uncharacterized protein n=1 Tax=Saprolegnia parasitica (strain CBS 223.65) TaxID=695850 RepID=A0A067BJL3_SAPPC|nr:hypothetical protein SPRG_16054 [Saprolegnia parasitica CBS 223.65]KDO18624.1 hypothetical protein SPRG_16054 [Saprolegnia parasitica CBS 223.65]|eukprot:XP_012210670.1 hypothetical protein SPRG_16054 [Saprolegnia parasitica CBS 223.65]